MATAYLGLGTNVGNKRGNLVTAAALLAERVGDVLALSDMYETEPWGFESDNTFLNAVIVMMTELSPMELLDATRLIEIEMGRIEKSDGAYHDRIIDIDLGRQVTFRIYLIVHIQRSVLGVTKVLFRVVLVNS